MFARVTAKLSRERRVRVPTVLQMEATECGAACLGMVLAARGRVVPLEELRAACGVSRDGSKAANVMRAARGYGLVPHGWRREPEQLAGMDLPMIIFWRFSHFVVLEGFHKHKVYLNDPAIGRRTVPESEFDEAFTGIAITFEEGDEFRRGGRRPSIVGSLLSHLGRSRGALLFVVLAGLLLVAPGIAVPALAREFVDSYLVGQRRNWLAAIVTGMALAAAMQVVLSALQQFAVLRLQTKLSVRMASDAMEHLLRLPASFFAQRAPGELAFRSTLSDQVAQALSGQFSSAALGIVTASFYYALMVVYDWQLSLLVLAIAGLNGVLLSVSSKKRQELSLRLTRSMSGLSGSLASGVSLIESVKASGREDDLFSRWVSKLVDLVEGRQSYERASLWLGTGPAVLSSLSSAAMLGLGAVQVMDGRITLGTLVAFQALTGGFLAPVGLLVSSWGTVQSMAGNLARIDDILDSPPDPALTTPPAPLVVGREPWPSDGQAALSNGHVSRPGRLSPLRGEVELRSLCFGYSPLGPPLIEGLDLHLRPGARVAVVGASGSGKSTLSRLVAGLYQPWEGEVLFDGRARQSIDRNVLAEGIAMVDQDVLLFGGSVADNLSLWDPGLPDADALRALMDAAILDDVLARPGGLHGPVAEGGSNFSGGQRQRLEIARALARDPAVIVLDEATSALDPLSEELVDQALRRRGCTCLIVAHRLSTVRDCDEIVVLERGHVVERGRHDELVRSGGPYARLVEA